MDKPGSGAPDGERERGERGEQMKAAIKDRIALIAKQYKTMNMAPDLGDIWESDDFKSLAPDARNEIRAWAVQEGHAASEDAKQESPEDPVKSAIKDRIELVAKQYKAMNSTPDLGDIWESEDFKSLSADAQAELRGWADEKYGGTEAPRPQAPERERPDEERTQEKAERGEEPGGFVKYRVTRDKQSGELKIVEDYKKQGVSRDLTRDTFIVVPPSAAERFTNDEKFREEVLELSEDMRREINRTRPTILFDNPKNPERIFAKWFFRGQDDKPGVEVEKVPPEIAALIKERPQDFTDADEWKTWVESLPKLTPQDVDANKVPMRIVAQVHADPKNYFKGSEYKWWIGNAKQRKRGEIISAELEERYGRPEEPVAAKPPEPRRAEMPKEAVAVAPTGPERPPAQEPKPAKAAATPEAPKEVREMAELPPVVREGIRIQVDHYARLYKTPEDAAMFVDLLRKFAASGVDPEVPRRLVSEALHEALLARFADDERRLAALRAAIDKSSDKGSRMESEKKKEDDPAYVAFRRDIDALKDVRDLDKFAVQLAAISEMGMGGTARAAERMLNDIEYGRVGALSEERRTGFKRERHERPFFEKHPGLDRRNFQQDSAGALIVYLDRSHPTESLERALKRLAEDALAAERPDDQTMDRTVEYLAKRFREGFPPELGSFDQKDGQLVIRAMDTLAARIAGIAREIQKLHKGQ